MIRREVTLDIAGRRIRAWHKTVPAPMPVARDTSPGAEAYRRRNRGKAFEVYEFSIPFATTLEGDARWTEPSLINLADLDDPFDGLLVRNIAHQTGGPREYGRGGWRRLDGVGIQPFDWHDTGAIETEDCCWLTIQTPVPKPGAALPVRVHAHGGGNTNNPRHLPRYGGEFLPMVSVLVEYPLSTFGFFTHRALGEDHQINTAYVVMLQALQWVQDNIAAVGGDPDCVTLEGPSAGGQMASLLMPHSGGLYHRAVSHSGAGAGRRSQRWRAAARGAHFWKNLVKDRPAYYDRSRTIAQIAAEDGIAEALRLGPSPEDVLHFGNHREVYTFGDGTHSTRTVGPVNIWPARDGTIIQHNTAIGQVVDGVWPTAVPYMATYVSNEAGLVDNARDVVDPQNWWRVLRIDPEDQAEGIALLERPGDRWQRRLYGMLYGYGAERLCREHSLNGAAAFYGYFTYDSVGNGRSKPSHVNQQVYFLAKPWWQKAQGEVDDTLLLYEGDIHMGWLSRQALINFARHGDPSEAWRPTIHPDLYDGLTVDWPEFGGEDRNFVTLGNSPRGPGGVITPGKNHERSFFDFVDARYVP